MNAHSGTLTDVTPMHPAGTLAVVIPATAMLVIRAVDSLAQTLMNVEATMEDANTTAKTQWEVTGAPVGLGIASAVMDTDVKM